MKWLVLFIMMSTEILVGQVWHQKVAGIVYAGNPLTYNPLNSNIIYGAAGTTRIYISRDKGNTWSLFGNDVPGNGIIKSIAVNPLDTLQLLVGVEMNLGIPDRIVKTTDGGMTWTQTWGGTFSYYGHPVEFKPVHPDTVYTMGNDTLWRSTDFGNSWDTVRIVNGLFTAWCDAEIREDSANIIYIGDASSGIWKTTDYGYSWRNVFHTAGEIPCIAADPFNPRIAYAGRFGGSGIEVGGLLKTTDGGETWNCLDTPIKICSSPTSGNGWWVAPCLQRSGYIYFGTYGANPAGIFLSRNGGISWDYVSCGFQFSPISQPLNYGLLALDTNSVIAVQENGIWKLDYDINLKVLSPNGGERWDTGSHHTISWIDTSIQGYSNDYVRLEYSIDNGRTWSLIVDSLQSFNTSYDWMVPPTPSDSCRLKITDADRACSVIADESDSVFRIQSLSSVEETVNLPREYSMGQNYPNPFNPITRFSFSLPFQSDVNIKVYSVLGQEVATLVDAVEPAGTYSAQWDGKNAQGIGVGSGMYYVKMTASGLMKRHGARDSDFSSVRKILLLK